MQQIQHILEASGSRTPIETATSGIPAFVNVPERQLLSSAFGRQRACLINPAHALTSPVAPGNPFAGSGNCALRPQPPR